MSGSMDAQAMEMFFFGVGLDGNSKAETSSPGPACISLPIPKEIFVTLELC
jgi:hypothetical protein